ncbi:MAG TPA: Uma2 family endonuclease [Flavisolibacter sp.]|jgi:Uma2 family endonuclease
MSISPAIRYMTAEEYLAMEDASPEKHEFIGGEVYAMAGAGFAHNQIVSNAQGEIFQFLKNKSCRIYGSDLKIHVKTTSGFVYPDLSIVCHGAQFMENRGDVVTNPSVIIEVLSPDTQDFDHGKKFMLYRQIPSLKEYILISSMEILVEKFVRHDDAWTLTEYKSPDNSFSIETIGYQTTLAEIYRDVVFEPVNNEEPFQ